MTIYTPYALPATAPGPQTRSPFYPSVLLATSPEPIDPANNTDLTQKEDIRHILLGSPSAIRQVIHQLHTLHYVDPTLWSPISNVRDRLIITPEQGEAISLLRRSL